MGYNSSLWTTFLFVATLCVLLPQASAFGAGDIPDFAYLNDKAFRHGDIESILEKLAKTAGRASIGGSGLLNIAASVIQAASGPAKFSKSDIKKVYFGNWLRDYSQAMDIAGLTKLSADTLVLIVSILGFMTFGFSTEEFQVTADRLGVYLPVEHIDNPKGYAEKEGDARNFHPKLRPPVDERELEVDPNTGMKKYMATENQGWDTSTAFIRRTFRACIEAGRRAQGREGAELWEAYRLLGTGLHTMEDLLAHSNWCELALRKMGHSEVFCHVGDRVIVNTPNGPAPPLVTGTFGGADFLHSLLGEAGDKLSQASVTDLSNKMTQAQQGESPNIGTLKTILSSLMGGGGSEANAKLDQGEQMQQQAQGYNFDPDNAFPPEVKQRLVELLKWHDDVMRQILKKVEMVPGLTTLLEEFSNALNAYIYTILAPYVTPVLTQTTQVLDEGSKAVIDNHDQYEVFDNASASDPSHSLLSKDHFGLILNEPAGKIAQILVEYSVNLIVEAWSDNGNADQVINQILEAFHHPYYNNGRSQIQNKMFEEMQRWIGGLGPTEASQTIQALTKESVREHKNKRLGSENQNYDEPGYAGCGHGPSKHTSSAKPSKPSTGATPAYGTEYESKPAGRQDGNTGYGRQNTHTTSGAYGSGGRQDNTYGSGAQGGGRQEGYGSGRSDNTYGSGAQGGGRQEGYGGGRAENSYESGAQGGDRQEAYGVGRQDDTYGLAAHGTQQLAYGSRRQETQGSGRQEGLGGYGRQSEVSSGAGGGYTPTYGGAMQAQPSYGGGGRQQESYGRTEPATQTYGGGVGGGRKRDDEPAYGGGYGGGGHREEVKPTYGGGHGGGRRDEDEKPNYGGGKKHRDDDDDKPKYGGGGGYGRRDDDNKPSGYGGGNTRRDDDDDKPKYGGGGYGRQTEDITPSGYGGSHKRDDSDDKPKYGAGGYGRQTDDHKPSGYGGSHKRDDSDEKPKYGGGYGGRQDDDDRKKDKYRGEDSDDERKKKKSYGQPESSGYAPSYGGGGGYGGGRQEESGRSAYAPAYGGRNETFGAERMKIASDDSDEDKKKKKYGRRDY